MNNAPRNSYCEKTGICSYISVLGDVASRITLYAHDMQTPFGQHSFTEKNTNIHVVVVDLDGEDGAKTVIRLRTESKQQIGEIIGIDICESETDNNITVLTRSESDSGEIDEENVGDFELHPILQQLYSILWVLEEEAKRLELICKSDRERNRQQTGGNIRLFREHAMTFLRRLFS